MEEISLVNEISFLKENNEAILREYGGFVACIVDIHEGLKRIMAGDPRETCSHSEEMGVLWLRVAENLMKISKNLGSKIFEKDFLIFPIENVVALYREKSKQEEEGVGGTKSRLIYVFSEQIPVNKFKIVNQNIASTFQGFISCAHSAIISFAEYLQRTVF